MNKLATALLGAALALSPVVASAASISNPLFSNGQTSIDATGGSTVNGTFTLTVGPGEVVEWLRVQSDPSQPFVDTSIGGQLGNQEQVYTNVPFSVKVPPNTGNYNPTVQGAGTFGGARSINGGDNVVLGATGLGTVRVVASGSESTGGTDAISEMRAQIAALMSQIAAFIHPVTPPAPTTSAACAAFAEANKGTQMGVYNNANIGLQGFLLSPQGGRQSIPALTAGAAFGFYGNQTASAVASFQSMNHCN